MSREPASSRYRPATGVEAEGEPGSRGRVLRNKPGIQRKREMDRAEFEALTHAQMEFLGRVTTETRFTADLLRSMHRSWLGGLYEWAGEYRTVEMEQGGFRWPPADVMALQAGLPLRIIGSGGAGVNTSGPCILQPSRGDT